MQTSVFVGTSVDGFIARTNHGLDFLESSDGSPAPEGTGSGYGFEEFMSSVDALVMGRRTYDVVRGFGKWLYGEKPVIVLSSRDIGTAPSGAIVEHMSGEPREIIAALQKRGMKHLYIDGGATIQQFLRAGLITRMVISHVPVLIGSGIPLFGSLEHDIQLQLVSTRRFAGGMVQTEYRVVRAHDKK